MNYYHVLTVLVVLVGYSSSTRVLQCPSGGALPTVEIVSNNVRCVQSPCMVYSGAPAYININFTATDNMPSITPKYIATSFGLPVPYPVGSNACPEITNVVCPITKGQLVSYTHKMVIPFFLPRITVGLSITFVNDADKSEIFCFTTDVQVQ
ncbi:mite group 2 allergen Gly d 2.02-like [Diabrotica virgifera virgifera]|uniref:MD-2-related lipid-recognition domain-containing protein n=1 Tax=Diabrotica virgifera virgifera TaxID=50390 RepID=A0ABM5K950_DIAVI|nr:mite group 2 allergen Gly d 2.02-like [Diabrotica virgifera virgifera]